MANHVNGILNLLVQETVFKCNVTIAYINMYPLYKFKVKFIIELKIR